MSRLVAVVMLSLLVAACFAETRRTADGSTATTQTERLTPQSTAGTPPTSAADSASGFRDPALFKPLGEPGCDPPSPVLPWPDADDPAGGLAEVRATSDQINVWGLLWRTPPLPAGEEIKMVWAANGTGDFQIRAAQNDTQAELVMGPVLHAGSNWDRPGEEWGTAFVFPTTGCWEITISRGTDFARVWVEVDA